MFPFVKIPFFRSPIAISDPASSQTSQGSVLVSGNGSHVSPVISSRHMHLSEVVFVTTPIWPHSSGLYKWSSIPSWTSRQVAIPITLPKKKVLASLLGLVRRLWNEMKHHGVRSRENRQKVSKYQKVSSTTITYQPERRQGLHRKE